jgi:hypothetical protein
MAKVLDGASPKTLDTSCASGGARPRLRVAAAPAR